MYPKTLIWKELINCNIKRFSFIITTGIYFNKNREFIGKKENFHGIYFNKNREFIGKKENFQNLFKKSKLTWV